MTKSATNYPSAMSEPAVAQARQQVDQASANPEGIYNQLSQAPLSSETGIRNVLALLNSEIDANAAKALREVKEAAREARWRFYAADPATRHMNRPAFAGLV